jgi:hypothetical protein
MKRFIAKIVFGIHNSTFNIITQFDEQIRLIEARDEYEAFLKSKMLGVREEYSFLNENDDEVKWEFINVSDIYQLDDLKDGLELYSRIHETDHQEHYIRYINDKALQLEDRMAKAEADSEPQFPAFASVA